MATELTQLAYTLIDAINDRDWEWTAPAAHDLRHRHVSPDFSAQMDAYAWTMSFDEQVAAWKRTADEHEQAGGVRFELVHVDCAVRAADRTAVVTMHTVTHRGRLRLRMVCQQQWKFTGGRWLWCSMQGMRGMPDVLERL